MLYGVSLNPDSPVVAMSPFHRVLPAGVLGVVVVVPVVVVVVGVVVVGLWTVLADDPLDWRYKGLPSRWWRRRVLRRPRSYQTQQCWSRCG